MPSPPEDAPVSGIPPETTAQLAILYDRFANALDPFAPERDLAEKIFEQEVAGLYDSLPPPKIDLRTFKRAIVFFAVAAIFAQRTNRLPRKAWRVRCSPDVSTERQISYQSVG